MLRFGIEESIKIIESFKYNPNFVDTINEKNKILENIFSDDALLKYKEVNDEYNSESDLYYGGKRHSKEVAVSEISFLDAKNNNILNNIRYKIFGIKSIDHINVLISIYNDVTGDKKIQYISKV